MSNPRATTENLLKNRGFKGRVFTLKGDMTKRAQDFWAANFGGRNDSSYHIRNQTAIKNINVRTKYDKAAKKVINLDEAHIMAGSARITFEGKNENFDINFSLSNKIKGQPNDLMKSIKYGDRNWKNKALEEIEDRMQQFITDYNFKIVGIELEKPKVFSTKKAKGKLINNIKLKRASALRLDGMLTETKYDTRNGTCTFDFISGYYKNSRIHKKFIKIEYFDELFPGWEINGLSINDIEKWCIKANVNMLALDKDEKLISRYFHPDAKHNPTLCYIVHNNHLYGFTDKKKIISFSHKYSDGKTKFNKKEAEREAETKNYKIEVINLDNINTSSLIYAIEFMVKNNVELKDKNLIWNKQNLEHFICDEKKTKYFFHDPRLNPLKKYFEEEKEGFNGQKASAIVYKAMDKCKFEFSEMNPILREFFDSRHLKDMTQQGFFGDNNEITDDMWAYDINKCHTSIIENPGSEWIVLDYDARIENYEGQDIELGLYYVETDNAFFTGNKPYSSLFVSFGLEEGLITKDNIKKFIKASRALPKNYVCELSKTFNEFVNMENPHAKSVLKLLNNTVSGILGKHKKCKTSSHITTSHEEAFIWLAEHKDEDIFIHEIERGDRKFYVYGSKKTVILPKNNMPMYIQILSEQLMKLYKGIKSMTGGDFSRLVYRNIDSFTIRGEPSSFEMVSERKGNFSLDVLPKKCFYHPHKNIVVDWGKYTFDWNYDNKINTSNDYEMFYDYIDNKKSLNIQGPAGYGKTYIIEKLIKKYGEENILRIAFTNCCALRIGGKTMHSQFKINYANNTKIIGEKVIREILKNKSLKAIILDEQGVLTAQLWSLLYQLKERVNVSFFLFGDFLQLPPIDGKQYLENEIVKKISDKNLCELKYHEKCRHDSDMHEVLKDIRVGKRVLSVFEKVKYNRIQDFDVHIAFTNAKCSEVNEICCEHLLEKEKDNKVVNLDKMIKKLRYFNKHIDIPTKDFMSLCCNMPLIGKRNNHLKNYYNGERFKIIDIKRNEEAIKYVMENKNNTSKEYAKNYLSVASLVMKSELDEKKIIVITTYDFLMDLDIAFCMTNHKLLGETIKKTNFLMHEINYHYSDSRWLYTGISRGKSISQVFLQL